MRNVLLVGAIVGTFVVGGGPACDDGGEVCVADCMGRECGLEPNCGREMCGYCPAERPSCNDATGRCEGGAGCTQGLCLSGSTQCCAGGAVGTWNATLVQCVCGGGNCGNGSCDWGEDCGSCPADCGSCPGFCGDGFCEPGRGESCGSCDRDCGACPYCGDWSCNGDETCATCDTDCGACPCTSALCSSGSTLCCAGGNPGTWNAATLHCDCYACTTPSDCGAEDICVSNRCESAWGRAYRITVVDATFPAGIDSDDSLPDCYVVTTVDGSGHRTSTVDDDLTPYWNEYFDATLYATSTFTWTVYDWDPIDDDELFWRTAGYTSVDVDWLRTGSYTFHNDSWTSSLTYRFEPR